MLHKILELLHGKKAIIVALCFITVAYLFDETLINENLRKALEAILMVLAGGADLATGKYLNTTRK